MTIRLARVKEVVRGIFGARRVALTPPGRKVRQNMDLRLDAAP
jgi:hypothetical protein